MRLTAFTDYAFRVLIYLAINDDKQSTIREIAQCYGISRNHLMKVVQELSSTGYVTAVRGKNGGLILNKPPSEIRIGELINTMENGLALAECFGENNRCILTPSCELRRIFTEGLQAFFTALDGYTLEDVLPGHRRAELVRILNIDPHIPATVSS